MAAATSLLRIASVQPSSSATTSLLADVAYSRSAGWGVAQPAATRMHTNATAVNSLLILSALPFPGLVRRLCMLSEAAAFCNAGPAPLAQPFRRCPAGVNTRRTIVQTADDTSRCEILEVPSARLRNTIGTSANLQPRPLHCQSISSWKA